MDKDDLPEETKNVFCIGWSDLIFSPNRGQVYDFFNREREELITHLGLCDLCKNFLFQIDPMPMALVDDMEFLKGLTPQEFADFIREVYKNALGMGFSDDDEDTIP